MLLLSSVDAKALFKTRQYRCVTEPEAERAKSEAQRAKTEAQALSS